MKIIYADSLVLLNAAVDYLLLISAGKLCALPLRRGRMALGALWGGAYALLAAAEPRFWALWSVKIAAGALCVLIAYGFERRTPRALAAFFAVSAAFGGVSRLAASLGGEPAGAGEVLSARVLLLSFAVCYAVIALVFRRVGAQQGGQIHDAAVSRNGREVPLRHGMPFKSAITSSTLRPTTSLATPCVLPGQPPTISHFVTTPSAIS